MPKRRQDTDGYSVRKGCNKTWRKAAVNSYLSSAGFSFLGLPFPGTLRMDSSADLSYMASAVMGFMFATYSRCRTAFGSIPNSAAISEVVHPSSILCGIYQVYAASLGRSRKK